MLLFNICSRWSIMLLLVLLFHFWPVLSDDYCEAMHESYCLFDCLWCRTTPYQILPTRVNSPWQAYSGQSDCTISEYEYTLGSLLPAGKWNGKKIFYMHIWYNYLYANANIYWIYHSVRTRQPSVLFVYSHFAHNIQL